MLVVKNKMKIIVFIICLLTSVIEQKGYPLIFNDYHEENRYFLLYYQFIKHAFGLQYIEPKEKYGFHLSALLDELPEKDDRCKEFKEYLNSLEKYPPFRRRGWQISENDVADVNSKNHIILQGLDIILGGMQFRLNDKHKEKIPGTSNRGKRTIAKEKLYKYINKIMIVKI